MAPAVPINSIAREISEFWEIAMVKHQNACVIVFIADVISSVAK